MTNQPPIRFAFYNRVCKEYVHDPEAARTQPTRCRAILEYPVWKTVTVYADCGESPYRRGISQPEAAVRVEPTR